MRTEPLEGTRSRLAAQRVRQRVGEIILPVIVLGALALVGGALLAGAVNETAWLALALCLLACVGGGALAATSIRWSRPISAQDPQATDLHPGWLRYGPVGGGLVSLVGFIVTSLLRAPLFIPVFATTAVLGTCLAVVLWRVRSRTR